MRKLKAFTIIEFVVVIVLIGIISIVIIPRFLSRNAFNELAARDAIVAGIRSAQQAALGRSDVTFEIEADADQWLLTTSAGGATVRELSISASDVVLETGSTAATADTCASGATFEEPVDNFVIAFDARGNIESFSNTTVGLEDVPSLINGVRVCINDSEDASLCVSPAGYAYAGNCDA